MSYFRDNFEEIIQNLDIFSFFEVQDLEGLIDLIRSIGIIHAELPENYLFDLFYVINLKEEDKVILAIILIIRLQFESSTEPILDYLMHRVYSINEKESLKNYYPLLILLYFMIENIVTNPYRSEVVSFEEITHVGIVFQQYRDHLEFFEDDTLTRKIEDVCQAVDLSIQKSFKQDSLEIIKILYFSKSNHYRYTRAILLKLFMIFVKIDSNSIITIVDASNLDKMINCKKLNKHWIEGLFDTINYNQLIYDKDIIPHLNQFSKHSAYEVRIATNIILWILTDDLKFIRNGKKNARSNKEHEKLEKILEDPEGERSKYKLDCSKFTDKIKSRVDLAENRGRLLFTDPDMTYHFRIRKRKKIVKMRGDQSLDELAYIIHSIYDLDEGHLYAFYMNNKPWSRFMEYSHPEADGPSAEDINIHELNLQLNQKFLFIHDFGSETRIQIEFLNAD